MVRKWIRALPRAGQSQLPTQGNPLEVTARKPPYTTWRDDSQAHAPGWGLPYKKLKHTPLKASGVTVGAQEPEQGSTPQGKGAQGSARLEQPPSLPSLYASAPLPPPTRRNLAFPGRGKHEWNSPEADCTGYPALRSFILASGNRREASSAPEG